MAGCWLNMQINAPCLQPRADLSATAFSLNPELTEVILFGGCPEWPSEFKTLNDLPHVANTTVLRFGESTSCLFSFMLVHCIVEA